MNLRTRKPAPSARKKTLDDPDSQEREYTRDLLRYARALQADVGRVLISALGEVKDQYSAELRVDTWSDTLDSLISELGVLAAAGSVTTVQKLPGHFLAISKFNDGQFRMVAKANTGLLLPPAAQPGQFNFLLGVNVFRDEPFLSPLADDWIKTNTDLIKSLPTRLHPELKGIVQRGVKNGVSVRDLAKQIKAKYEVNEYRARLIAQDQTLKLHSDLTKYRLQSVGVKEYTWRTVGDSRVRPEHVERNGKVYSWDKPPSGGLHPGQEVRCRCRAEAVWDDEDET